MKNKLIVIGCIGSKICYLNITVDVAINRYCKSQNIDVDEFDEIVEVIEFEDELNVYDIFDNS